LSQDAVNGKSVISKLMWTYW